MSLNVGGIYVRDRAGRKRVTQADVVREIDAHYRGLGCEREDKGAAAIKPLSVSEGKRKLGFAVFPPSAGWITVADSERYSADHALAQHLASRLGAEVLWYVLYGATDGGVARWFGSKRSSPEETYGAVESLVNETGFPLTFVYFDDRKLGARDGVEVIGFKKLTLAKYDTGPEPAEPDEDEPAAPPSPKAAKRRGKQPDALTALALDPRTTAPFKPIRLSLRDKTVVGRDTLSLGFALRVPFAKAARAVEQVMDAYVAAIPAGVLRWVLTGASSTTTRKLKTLDRVRGMLDPKTAAKTEHTFFWLAGDDEWPSEPPQAEEPEAPSFLFHCSGERDIEPEQMDWGWLRPTSRVEMRFPSAWLWQVGVERFVELATRIATMLPVESGFASIALTWNPMLTETSQEAPPLAAPLLLAHPGLDLADDPNSLGEHCRGAFWLTFLGPGLVKQLGGEKKLLASLDGGVRHHAAGDALVLRAGDAPLPDPAKPQLAQLTSIAKAVAPVTLFDCDSRVFENDAASARYLYRYLGGKAPKGSG